MWWCYYYSFFLVGVVDVLIYGREYGVFEFFCCGEVFVGVFG